MRDHPRGFVLITAMLLILLTSSIILFLQLRITSHWRMAAAVESQLYSLVLAQNGIEYARTLLPHLEIASVLRGRDGIHSGTGSPQWRNPVTFEEARRLDPATLVVEPDDGVPSHKGIQLPDAGVYRAANNGYFLLRFSNNPEEPPDKDDDHIVVVRSLGIVPSLLKNPSLPDINNNVSLVEARLRQERAFFVPSPLTLFADAGTFHWEGTRFTIETEEGAAVSLVGVHQSRLYRDLIDSLSETQQQRFRGHGALTSLRDASQEYLGTTYRDLFSPDFWNHFITQLPEFSDGLTGGIAFLPRGGVIGNTFAGVLVAKGNLVIADRARIRGLVLHLGDGTLRLEDEARITGAVWMSNLETSGQALQSRPLSLRVSDAAAIRYDLEAVREALGRLPPTQLGWRILFPETGQ